MKPKNHKDSEYMTHLEKLPDCSSKSLFFVLCASYTIEWKDSAFQAQNRPASYSYCRSGVLASFQYKILSSRICKRCQGLGQQVSETK
ncbi:hypothetical protein, partial [Idiomarina zobellii]|uniref:hypothetical protein n=1 Tax=Idiomarina zobellii TaxID=86103 RepID=UPI001F36A8F0